MGISRPLARPRVVLRKVRPDPRRAKEALRRLLECPGDAKIKGKSTEQIVQMARLTREQLWKEKLAPRP